MRTCRPLIAFTLFVTLLAFVAPLTGWPGQETLASRIDSIFAAKMAAAEAVGGALALIDGGRVVHVALHGAADREQKLPVSRQTLFRWASVSKPITAVAAMQLVEKGLLDLDQDVRHYVPEWPDKGTKITSRQVLCHQAGIVHYINGPVIRTQRTYDVAHPFADVVLALDRFKESPLVCPPGSKYSYTTHGYILLSAVVERAGKQRFADQVRDRIAAPLGLKTLQPDYQWVDIPGRARGYLKRDGKIVPSANTDVSWKLGGGGYLSSIEDLAGFAAGLLEHKLVQPATAKQMWTAQKTATGEPTRYGLGFSISKQPGVGLVVMHTGAQEKTRTAMILHPEKRRGLVFMTNSEYVEPGPLAAAVLEAVWPTKR